MIPNGIVVVADGPEQNGASRHAAHIGALQNVANRPIVHHVLDALRAADVEELLVLGSPRVLPDVERSLSRYEPMPRRLEFMPCIGGGIAGALRAAVPLVADAPCIVHVAEGLLDEPLGPLVDALQDRASDVVLVVPRELEGNGHRNGSLHAVSSFVPSTNGKALASAGIGLFAAGALRSAGKAAFNTDDLTLVGERLAECGGRIQLHVVDAWRGYAGNPKDLLELNRVVLDSLVSQERPGLRSTNRIEGRVHVDPSANVTSSVIVGPAIIGANALVENAYIGPYTSIGPGVRIEGAEIERSIISAGASVMHVPGRLESSVVGRAARVYRDFSLPRALRVRVSDGDEVAFC